MTDNQTPLTSVVTPLAGAIGMIKKGYKVFPIAPNSKVPPKGIQWQQWAHQSNSVNIVEYATAHPHSNYAVHAEDMVILDVDKPDNLSTLVGDNTMPETFTVNTPNGGRHYYFRGVAKNSVSKLARGIDIRSTGGYVLTPGSTINDKQYTIYWDADLVSVPEWLSILIEKKDKKEPLNVDDLSYIADGSRNDTITKFAGGMRRYGFGYDAILAAIMVENDRLCNPPLATDDLENIARSVARYAPETASVLEDFSAITLDTIGPMKRSDFIGKAPERQWLIKNWLPLNEISSLYGAGGRGKSLLALQLAMAITANKPFLDLIPEMSIPTLAVFCEDSAGELHRRLEAIENAPEYEFMRQSGKSDSDLLLWPRVGLQNDIARISNNGNDVVPGPFRTLLEEQLHLMKRGPKLLILDTLSDVYLGNENVREMVNKFVKSNVGSLVKEFELTVLIIAHPSRTGLNTKDMLSGSTAWENAVRNRLAMTQHKDFEDITVLRGMKSNYAKAGNEILMQWDNGRFRIADITRVAEKTLTLEQKDILLVVAKVMGNHIRKSLHSVAKNVLADGSLAHIFSNKTCSTVERAIQLALQYPRESGGHIYWFEDVEIEGLNGSRWVRKKVESNIKVERTEKEFAQFSAEAEIIANLLE